MVLQRYNSNIVCHDYLNNYYVKYAQEGAKSQILCRGKIRRSNNLYNAQRHFEFDIKKVVWPTCGLYNITLRLFYFR